MKRYYFLAGLPRSGNTLLSSILNQNPDIMVSANSFLCDYFQSTAKLQWHEKFVNFPDSNSLNDLLSSTFDSYYKNWDAKYIIDRSPWGTPGNLYMLENYLNDEIKIIVTVRDIIEIICSILRINKDNLLRQINEQAQRGLRFPVSYKSEVEVVCDEIMQSGGMVDTYLFSLLNLLKEENRKYLHIVEYDDLVSNTEDTINKVYNFLEIEPFQHKYNYIHQFSANQIEYNDSIWKCDMHKLKSKIKATTYKLEDILPQHLIQRYSNLEFWRN